VQMTAVQLPVQTSLTHITILSESVKCEVTSKQWVTAVEDHKSNCSAARHPVYRPLQDLQTLGY